MARERSQSVSLVKTLIIISVLSRAANSELEQESYYRLQIPAETEGRQVLVVRVGCWKDYLGNHKKVLIKITLIAYLFYFAFSHLEIVFRKCVCLRAIVTTVPLAPVSSFYKHLILMPYLFLFWRTTRVVESSVSKAITLVVFLPK